MAFEEVQLGQDKVADTPDPDAAPTTDLEKSVHYDQFEWDVPQKQSENLRQELINMITNN